MEANLFTQALLMFENANKQNSAQEAFDNLKNGCELLFKYSKQTKMTDEIRNLLKKHIEMAEKLKAIINE